MICEKCKLEFFNNGSFIRHSNSCNLNDELIQLIINDYSINELTTRQIKKKYGITFPKLKNLFLHYNVDLRNLSSALLISKVEKYKHTLESKLSISKKRKEYLRLNPDKHPWKSNNKFRSNPCEKLKSILENMEVRYISEYPVNGRNYSIDISFPEKMIAIEVNGNQHYNPDGTLKEYYQNRHNYLEKLGWKVHELHYTIPYSKGINKIISNILNDANHIFDFDYDKFLEMRLLKSKSKTCNCGKEILKSSKSCRKCSRKSEKMPPIQDLVSDIKSLGYAGSGRKYKVSPTTIRRWSKKAP